MVKNVKIYVWENLNEVEYFSRKESVLNENGDQVIKEIIFPKTASLSAKFIRTPNKYKYTHFVEIDVVGLDVVKGRNGVYVILNDQNLDIVGWIVRTGQVGKWTRSDKLQYLHVMWEHNFIDEPQEFYMELNDERFQERVLEFYEDGKIAYATYSYEYNTFLAKEQYPEINEINTIEEFCAEIINKEEFEKLWSSKVTNNMISNL